jgi:tetratricopeptide (TPR) repeat protein
MKSAIQLRGIIFWTLCFFSSIGFGQNKISDFKKVDENIYLVWYDQYENKSIIAEFDKYLVLVEFPQNDSVSIDIITKARELFPKKPIKFVLHSHHHPHSISSFDPFLKLTNATLVTTKYNLQEVKNITKDTITLFNRNIIYDSTYIIKDRINEVVCYNILQSNYTVPTKEYQVFYFPNQQMMISGCLFNKPKAYYEIVNARKPALKKFIADHDLTINTFIPTNTSRINGFEDICTTEMLDSTLVKGINPNQFMDNFQSKTFEYLESKMDSLELEFKRIPRSFDYNVLANGLRNIRKDYNRAIIIYKVLSRIYPNENELFYFIGECYESKEAKIEAIAYYMKYLEKVVDTIEIKEINEKVSKLKE